MIRLENITKTYTAGDTTVKALSDISITFREKEFVSILGPSGCGKTTLLNILGGLDRYDNGDICVNNVSTKNYKDRDWDAYRNHYIGFVFQNYNLIPHLSVVENVELALSIGGTAKGEKRKRALDALSQVGLLEQAKKRPNQLSGGQMQRVAIARAIVNNPEIILADEPTGALDSETSIQVMDILKKISKKHLVIMVTHNKELAEEYSTRIINLFDGKMIGDTNPFKSKGEKAEQKKEKPKSAMSLLTAFSLSFKNLFTKKAKTLLVSFAGSIGIIGIALVLAVSTGMTSYVNSVQSDALGNYPITVSAISIDMEKFGSIDMGGQDDDESVDGDILVPYKQFSQYITYGHYNNLTTDFVNYVKTFEEEDKQNGNEKLNVVEYNYFNPVRLLTRNESGTVSYVQRINATSILSGGSSSPLYPMVDNMEFVMNQYDLIYGEMPTVQDGQSYSTDMLLVVDEGNKVLSSTLMALGIFPTTNVSGQYENISFEDIVGKEYKVLFNDDYYMPDSNNFEDITRFDKLDISNQELLSEKYNSLDVTLKISGVIRLKKDAPAQILTSGLVYMPSFESAFSEDCKNSLIARKQLANKESYEFYDNYVVYIAELTSLLPEDGYANVDEINGFLQSQYGYTISNDEAFELAMQQIGISSIPVSIKLYPKNFEAKDAIIQMIDEYNYGVTNENAKIVYSDTTGFLTSTLGQIVNIISYVLIAFAGISLVVSSIMIGIITYTSVIERTKEIGVLRSIGARKKDISRVFNMETFIIGLSAGTIGVLVSWILTFPISGIFKAISAGSITANLAILRVDYMVILIVISVVLTLIAGLFPARIASKKDPVKALRTE